MGLRVLLLFLCIVFILSLGFTSAAEKHEKEETSQRVIITAPRRNAGGGVIDGSGMEHIFNSGNETGRVSVSTVALFTMAMAAATGLGALPFFFLELDPQWAGICNGMAAGVMLAASFDLIQEGQAHGSGSWVVLGILAVFILSLGFTSAAEKHEKEETSQRVIITAPRRNAGGGVIDGSGMEHIFNSGALPFFFLELDPQWAGICNGMAAGVMLAASFDLIQEGQAHGSGSWVVLGILAGGIFIWLCKKILEQYGEVSMLDIKGADATKVILVVGIMTLHSFGEGSGVGVSFAGSKGLSQGILVTLAIAVHNIPEGLAVSMVLASRGVSPQKAMLWSVITSLPQPIVAVPSFICADAFNKFLPFATGFAAGCMIWMVMAEVLPDGFKESSPSQVASAATLSVAFMEALGALFEHFSHSYNPEDASGFFVSLLFGLGPLLGGIALVAFALSFRLQHALLTGVASGIAFILGA
ncbi:putative zinc transporter at3g08650 [Phtheirospermum japonicum]|uniref:Putative zinc transporter at3g08650 n=1 Tax=Phtheirospermum japonicum TaxID=374723 RepID=A0A830BUY2_9LAMI|nr:putative zinc transporter at3g08650 [Phtheirospermum japonicum]